MLGATELGVAQEPLTTPTEARDQEEVRKSDAPGSDRGQGGYRTFDVLKTGQGQEETPATQENQSDSQESIPVPVRAAEEAKSLGAQSFIDDVFRSVRNRWGFSLSAYQGYTSDIYEGDQPRQPSGMTAFASRVFSNFGRRKSRFHVDLGAGYQYYNRSDGLNNWDYEGNATYSNQLSRRVSFGLSDQFISSYNDSWSSLSLYSPINYYPNFSNEVLFNRQRINRNSLTADLNFTLTRKMQFGVYGAYRYYDYSKNTMGNSNAYDMGASLDYRIKNWLFLTSRYSLYLNRPDGEFGDANIVRLEPGALDFHLTRSWRVWASGGAQFSEYRGRARAMESINAGIRYISRDTTFSVTYQRGFTSAIGLSELLSSDVISALFGHRITPWMRGSLQSYYYRSTELDSSGLLRTLLGGGGLEFALSRNLVASVNGFFQNQNTRHFSIQRLGINRIIGNVGLQYFWPSRSERSNI